MRDRPTGSPLGWFVNYVLRNINFLTRVLPICNISSHHLMLFGVVKIVKSRRLHWNGSTCVLQEPAISVPHTYTVTESLNILRIRQSRAPVSTLRRIPMRRRVLNFAI
jgi:hypothetical protein